MIRKCLFTLFVLISLAACRANTQSEAAATPAAHTPRPTSQAATPTPWPEKLAASSAPLHAATQSPAQPLAPASSGLQAVIEQAELPPRSPVSLRFNQPMDPASAQTALLTYPWVEGDLRWEAGNTVLKFTPKNAFTPARQYRVFLSQALQSASGERFSQPQGWQVQIQAGPRVLTRLPAGDQSINRLPVFQLTFDRRMYAESLRAGLSVLPEVPFSLEMQAETAILKLERPLDPGIRYHFTLAGSAHDSQGNPLGEDYRWAYSLPNLVDELNGPETLTSNHPPVKTPLELHFNYAIDQATFEAAVRVSRPGQERVAGRWSWPSSQKAIFQPAEGYRYNTRYTITFAGDLMEDGGLPLPRPEALVYHMPSILAYWPAGGEYGPAPADSSVYLQFAQPVDQARTQAALTIEPRPSGKFEWKDNGLRFIPSDLWQPYTTYTVTLGTEAVDLQGRPLLEQPFSWRFEAQPAYTYSSQVSFGDYGPNAQVVDFDGRRAVQFIRNQMVASVDFSLYRLSLAQFLERYSSGFKGVAGYEQRPINLEGAALQAHWQVDTRGAGAGYAGSVFETILPDDVPAGLYILELQARQSRAQLILILTRNTLLIKQVEDQLVAWVTDINGAGLAGARVSVYTRDGALLAQGRSDSSGVFRARVGRDPQPLIVTAEDRQELTGRDLPGTDISVSGLSNEWLSGYGGWWGWWRPSPTASRYAVYLYSDRPIYQPGQTVYFKAIARQDDDAQISLPPQGAPITLRVRDARDNVVQTFELAANAFGTAHGQFQLAEGAMLGDYHLEAVLEGEIHRQVFKVQDYRKPDYQLAIATDAQLYLQGDPIQVEIDASYYFGQPVANAAVSIQRYELRPAYSYWWDDSDANQQQYVWYRTNEGAINGRTDASGHFAYAGWQAQMGGDDNSENDDENSQREDTFGVEVTLDDGSRQAVSAYIVYRVSASSEKLTLEPSDWLQSAGKPFTISAGLASLSGEPVASRPLRLELRQWDHQGDGYETVMQSLDLVTAAEGGASAQLTVPHPGYYQVRVSGRDSRGQEIYANQWIYVTSPRLDGWRSRYINQLTISADRESYAPGQVARLAIESSFSGQALLTFERSSTRRTQVVELTAPLTLLEAPLQADDAPNIFVTINAYQPQDTSLGPDKTEIYESLSDSKLRTATVELKVPVSGKSLNIQLEADQASYAPRQAATFHLRVTDEQGQPAAAEVSLALVDEAIFSLSAELSGPIHQGFYFERPNLVRTYDSMALIRWLMGGGGGGGGDDGPANPRSAFPDTAFWLPDLVTDQNGEAVVSITLPDSLTSWRLSAKAVTADTQVGEAYINVITQQPVVARPILPRHLTSGDQFSLSAMLHSYAAEPLDLLVSMVAAPADPSASLPLILSDPITQQVTLQPGEVRILGWSAQAASAGEALVTVRAAPASGDEHPGDAVQVSLPVLPLAVADVSTQVGAFEGDFSATLAIPEGVLESSTVRVELSRSIAGSLLTGLEYLTGYPYGCVEQTMSRALPNAVIGRAFHQLGMGSPTLQADLPPLINAGLQRLYGFQHNDGGWGWWFDDQSNDYQTAWVVFGLSITAQAGYEVDPLVIQRGAQWLAANLAGMDIRTQAYALYSLAVAGYGDLQATLRLSERPNELDTFSQAGLALALHTLGAEAEANQVLQALAESAVQRDGYVYWPNPNEDGHYYQKTMASSVRSTALALDAFVRIQPGHALEPGIVRWLMSQKRTEGWGSTNETSYTILALSDHLLTLEDSSVDSQYALSLNGQLVQQGALGRGEPVISLEMPANQFIPGLNALDIRQTGGRLFYVIRSQLLFPQPQIEAAGDIRVERSYVHPRTGQPLEQVLAGQLVKVVLKVHFPQNGYFIIVEDRLPGGLEALNESLNTTSHEAVANEYEQYDAYTWQDYGYNNKEVRAERVSFFISQLEAGERTFSYLARAAQAGAFAALPAEAYAMYDLSYWGRSASGALVVQAAP